MLRNGMCCFVCNINANFGGKIMVGCVLMLCSLIDTDLSEELAASILRVEISILFVCKNAAFTSRFI
jgi:muramoyltetrapeptide carboxypeptidase LdcA involved in peptidoglycan recycling